MTTYEVVDLGNLRVTASTPVVAGPRGAAGVITPGLQALHDEAVAARDEAEAARAGAEAVGTTNDAVIAGRVNDPASATRVALSATYVAVFTPEKFGAVGDGATDDSAAVQAALQAAYTAGGGVVHLSPGKTYRCNSQLTIPNDGAAIPAGKYIRITGAGSDGVLYPNNAGATLDLRYSGANAKILALGRGSLELDHFTLTDKGTSSTPFLLTTNTIVNAHDMTVLGNPSKTLTACDQDVFVFGGTVGTVTGDVTGGFQGYGSIVSKVQFNRIRRAAYFRTWANAVQFANNIIASGCGSNLANGAAVEADGTSTSGAAGFATGNIITGNLFQMQGYVYGVKLTALALGNIGLGNTFWDGVAATLAAYRAEAGTDIQVLGGWKDPTVPAFLSDAGGNSFAFTRLGYTAGANGHQFSNITVHNGGIQVPHGLLAQHRDSGATVNKVLEQWGIGAGIGNLQVEDRGNPTTRRILAGYNTVGAVSVAVDPINGLRTLSGATGSRPTLAAGDAGSSYFDTTLGKPVWWSGSAWKDATGATV